MTGDAEDRRYRLDDVLGSGAFATVWKEHHPELDAVVAVKVLADSWSVDADVRERFTAGHGCFAGSRALGWSGSMTWA
jgi:hypothetical protein